MLAHLIAFLLFCIVATITPGPNNIMLMSSGVNFGVQRSLPHYLGICFGFPTMFIILGLGFGRLFIIFPLLHQIIKILGALYLLYLAWKIAQSKSKKKRQKTSKPFTFKQAILFQWVNPKAWVMSVGAIATYTSLKYDINAQNVLMSFISFLICFPFTGTWLFFGNALQKILKSEKQQRIFNYSMGLLLAASVVLIFFE